jgi:hypothetical protein
MGVMELLAKDTKKWNPYGKTTKYPKRAPPRKKNVERITTGNR